MAGRDVYKRQGVDADGLLLELGTQCHAAGGGDTLAQAAGGHIHARVINIHTIKPLDEDLILKAAKECGKIVTAEEHNVIRCV